MTVATTDPDLKLRRRDRLRAFLTRWVVCFDIANGCLVSAATLVGAIVAVVAIAVAVFQLGEMNTQNQIALDEITKDSRERDADRRALARPLISLASEQVNVPVRILHDVNGKSLGIDPDFVPSIDKLTNYGLGSAVKIDVEWTTPVIIYNGGHRSNNGMQRGMCESSYPVPWNILPGESADLLRIPCILTGPEAFRIDKVSGTISFDYCDIWGEPMPPAWQDYEAVPKLHSEEPHILFTFGRPYMPAGFNTDATFHGPQWPVQPEHPEGNVPSEEAPAPPANAVAPLSAAEIEAAHLRGLWEFNWESINAAYRVGNKGGIRSVAADEALKQIGQLSLEEYPDLNQTRKQLIEMLMSSPPADDVSILYRRVPSDFFRLDKTLWQGVREHAEQHGVNVGTNNVRPLNEWFAAQYSHAEDHGAAPAPPNIVPAPIEK